MDSNEYYERKKKLAQVFEDTSNMCRAMFQDDIKHSIKNTKVMNDEFVIPTNYEKLKGDVEVIDSDTFDAAEKMISNGFNANEVCVLNMACESHGGGGVIRGSAAQEEALCRRSTLYNCLRALSSYYPIDGGKKGIYTPSVLVFKNNKYEVMKNPFYVNVVTVSALRKPILENGKFSKKDEETMKEKIRTMLKLSYGNKCVILGAFGCGAYGCPSREVSRVFKEVLFDEDMRHMFDKVIFAIIDDNNAFKANKDGNLNVFKEAFS